jgi:hypothetical protein
MEKGTITVEYISTNEQKADILMKPLGRTRFQELCGKVGIVDTQFAPQG